jgi:hypothetical protein
MAEERVMISIDQSLFLETLYRLLAKLEPDNLTESGKHDMEIKKEVDTLINYILTSRPSANQSAYPSIGISR